ncbi:hypothetical protein LTS08_007738 [Lithohypha guttulata]|nr:hypothetical protein LTS08_007738 [Lithohypha guttulata]
MYSLSLGYNYAWAEIKRKLTAWLCANHAPGSDPAEHVKSLQIHRAYKAARESGRTIIMARSGEIEEFKEVVEKAPMGYATVGTRRVGELEMRKDDEGWAKRQIIRNKMLKTWFNEQAEWLAKWTGGIADYENASNWWGRERKAFEMIYGQVYG